MFKSREAQRKRGGVAATADKHAVNKINKFPITDIVLLNVASLYEGKQNHSNIQQQEH